MSSFRACLFRVLIGENPDRTEATKGFLERPLSGSVSVSATGALSLDSTDGASYGLFDINMTSSGSTSKHIECYENSVDAAVKFTTKAKMVCVDHIEPSRVRV